MVKHNKCISNILAWSDLAVGKFGKKLWNAIFFALIWNIWFERNQVKFKGKTFSAMNLFQSVKVRVFEWIKSFEPMFPYSFHQFESEVLTVSRWCRR